MSRTLVVWCPDWPLVAAGAIDRPSAVVKANRVVATSRAAREEGVALGQRRREAEGACPGLEVLPDDPLRDLRSFEGVLSAVSAFTPLFELTRPGVCSLSVRGPARYFGGEEKLAGKMALEASEALRAVGGPESPAARVGVADTPFAARLAARSCSLVPVGATASWLAPFPVEALGHPSLAELLKRLGIATVGQLAALDQAVVSARFGWEGLAAHRLASGEDDHRLASGEAPLTLTVGKELEDPLESAEQVAFAAAGLAEELCRQLGEAGFGCTRLLVEASSAHGEELARWWRSDFSFSARAMVERVRWQLEGWLTGKEDLPSAGISLVRLTAGEVAPENGRQLGFLPAPAEASPLLERAVARLQGLLGPEAVGTAVLQGARSPLEQARFLPWGEVSLPEGKDKPWPGKIPGHAPAVVYREPPEARLEGAVGEEVKVSGRGRLGSFPARLSLPGRRPARVTAWAGPWPLEERWWDPASCRRRARLQVMLEDGSAHLLSLEKGRWRLEASYD